MRESIRENLIPKLAKRLRERVDDESVAVVAEAARALEPLLSRAADRRPGRLTSLTLKGARSLGSLTPAERAGRLARFKGRSISVVFADIADFTGYTAAHGDDAAIDLLEKVSHAVARATVRSQGEIVKHMGDGFLLVFSTPTRAARAALGIQEEMEAIRRGGDDVRMRIVIHEGRPTIEGDDIFGHDVNLAAHLLDHARPGTVIASNAAKERTEKRTKKIAFDRRRKVAVQGLKEKTEVWRVLAAAPEG